MVPEKTLSVPISSTSRVDLGLRWLEADADQIPRRTVASWPEFLAMAKELPSSKRLIWARLWPLGGVFGGVAALSGLLIWPNQSGVHLLLFLIAFWLMPVLLILWTAVSGLWLGRTPWWRLLITAHTDPVIALWFAGQSLLAQALYCISGLTWLWLMLATRQVIFYWSTSISAVSGGIEQLFGMLGLGLLSSPPVQAIAAAEAGAITGWENALLTDAPYWAIYLTKVVGLWILLPLLVLLITCQLLLRNRLAHWPDWNHRLRLRFEEQSTPTVTYQALQPEQPVTAPSSNVFATTPDKPDTAGFIWQILSPEAVPAGSITLGEGDFKTDAANLAAHATSLSTWYVAGHTVPTGDLADLLRLHLSSGGEPRIQVFPGDKDEEQLSALQHSWSVFLERNELSIPVILNTWQTGDSESGA